MTSRRGRIRRVENDRQKGLELGGWQMTSRRDGIRRVDNDR